MNVGSLSFADGYMRIACEPHVRNLLRRVFPQVSQRAGEEIMLSLNPVNARDLLWFTQRYPLNIGRKELKRLKSLSNDHEEAETAVNALLNSIRPPEDFELAQPAREYQCVAANVLMIKGGLLLGDDVGLGKTVSAICAMTRKAHLPALVVTLTHLPEQWASEIHRFAPELSVHILKTGQPYSLLPKAKKSEQNTLFEVEAPRMPDVLICNYSKLHGWKDVLAGVVKLVVFDECQDLRLADSNKYAAAHFIASKAALRLGLSATPIYGLGAQFHTVMQVLLPGCLGTRDEFLREYCDGGEQIKDPKAFGAYVRREGIMLRRTRKEVGRELPPCSNFVQDIEIDGNVMDRVQGPAMDLAKIILSQQQNHRSEKFLAAKQFDMLLRQATGIAKAPYVAEFVRMVLASEQKVILYGWHREVYRIWLEMLAEFNPVLYSGTESSKQKREAKEKFLNDPECRLMILSLRSGAGLDKLQHVCNVCIYGELDWAPGVHIQCTGRIWRDGQTEGSMAYYLLSDQGSDPVMADLLGIKKGQLEGVIDPDADIVEDLAVEAGHVKRLAQAYLETLGIAVTAPTVELPASTLLAA